MQGLVLCRVVVVVMVVVVICCSWYVLKMENKQGRPMYAMHTHDLGCRGYGPACEPVL